MPGSLDPVPALQPRPRSRPLGHLLPEPAGPALTSSAPPSQARRVRDFPAPDPAPLPGLRTWPQEPGDPAREACVTAPTAPRPVPTRPRDLQLCLGMHTGGKLRPWRVGTRLSHRTLRSTYKAVKSRFRWVQRFDSKAMLQKTVFLLALVAPVLMLENGLLRTPPMGWLAWERFRCNINCEEDPKNCISEQLFMEMADRLAQDGWRDLGYVYLNIDDCWIGGRDDMGRLIPDPKRFPQGIAFLADYAHSLGLKLGIYEDMGKMTCMGYPGTTLDKVELDAETFAEWKVDMLKLDGCFSTDRERAEGYPKMSAALNATGRPIAFSCSWPAYEGGLPPKVNYTLIASICNLWRNYDDIQDSWKSVLSILDWFVKHQDILQPVAGPGHWNDPDMLLIGNFGLSFEQSQAQMALWTILAAPLFMSTDLRTISPQNIDILQNPLIIKINQDPLGIQGRRIFKSKSQIEVFKRRLSNEASALVFFSRRTDMPYRFHFSLLDLKFPRFRVYEGQDVFTGDTISALHSETNYTVVINPSGVVMWYLYPIKRLGLSTMMSQL